MDVMNAISNQSRSGILVLAAALVLLAAGHSQAAERPLIRKEAERQEVRHSMIGPRDTLLFYSFPAQHAVLQLKVGNADASFPVSGKVLLFDPSVAKEDLAKWVNNQHSDGLFPEVPEPVEKFDLPEGTCQVTAKKLLGEEKHPPMNEIFRDYEITISVKACKVGGKFDLGAFEDQSRVFLKIGEA
jgi:hypothetical protein